MLIARSPRLSPELRRQIKRTLFYFITFLPLSVLIAMISAFIYEIYRINTLNTQEIVSQLNEELPHDRGDPTVFSFEQGHVGYRYVEQDKFIPFDYLPGDYLIYVFGESSVVVPKYETSFPALLERNLNHSLPWGKHFKVMNFGACGLESFRVKKRVIESVKYHRPNLIILYVGHNDYNNAYREIIKPKYYILTENALLSRIVKLSNVTFKPEPALFNILEFQLEPRLSVLLQRLNLLKLRPDPFEEYNRVILAYYVKNIRDIIRFAQTQKIPVVVMTPIGNMEKKIYGIVGITDVLYQRGLMCKDYRERLETLRRARDSEFMTGDIRAKTELIDFIRSLQEENVFVFDLEKEFMGRNFPFNGTIFLDYLHFTEQTHQVIAELLYSFLVSFPVIIN